MNIRMAGENFVSVHTQAAYLPDETVEVRKIDKPLPDENTYLKAKGLSFHNGVIEVDVCGRLLPDAPDFARGFIGIVFRANEADSEFESFYIRPTNGKHCTDPVRKAHGCQYFSYPGYTFSYFREFGISEYENTVDSIALNEWSHIRAEIQDDRGIFFVDGVKVLEVNGFKHGSDSRGCVGLYVDIGTDGLFRNLIISPED
ncbi:MAG: hypothetical protein IK127_03590 [Clostridia bacterium]|nr:hypothetical protein [Clostridia bacterium]